MTAARIAPRTQNGNVGLPHNSTRAQRQLTADAMRRQSTEQLQSDDLQARLSAQFNLQQLDRGVIPDGPGVGTRIDTGARVQTTMGMMTGGNVGNVGGNVGWGNVGNTGGGAWTPKSD
jgi:hypothetical protein